MKLTPLFIITIILLSVFTGIPTTFAVPAEQIVNGGFETAGAPVGAVFWNYDNWDNLCRVNTDSHSGTWSFNGYSVHNNQTFATPISVAGITELSYWHIGDQVPIVKIVYNDTTDEDITDAKSVGVWAQEDITADLDAGKFIERIELWCGNSNPIWYDDVTLLWESPLPVAVSATITDMDTTNNLYSMRKYYTFVGVVSTLADPCDVTSIEIDIMQGAVVVASVNGTTLDVVPAWSITAGATVIDLDTANCAWSVVGNTGTATFKVRTEWDFVDDSNLDLTLTAVNSFGSSGDVVMQTNYCDVIGTLVATMTTGTPDVPLNQVVNIYGNVYYPTTVGGLVASAFYPPDGQFTGVALYEDATLIATDNAIVNGYYEISFTPAIILMTHTYHIHLDLLPDYTDGAPANAPTLVVTVSNNINALWAGILWWLDKIFLFFGVSPYSSAGSIYDGVGPTQMIVNWITTMSSWFIDSVIMMINTTTMLGSIIINGGGFLISWGARVASTVVSITQTIVNLLNGTATSIGGITTGIGNIWSFFGDINNLLTFLPIMIIVWWVMSIDSRIISTGQNMFTIAIGDINTAYGLINIMVWFAMLIYSTIWGLVSWVFGLVGGVLT